MEKIVCFTHTVAVGERIAHQMQRRVKRHQLLAQVKTLSWCCSIFRLIWMYAGSRLLRLFAVWVCGIYARPKCHKICCVSKLFNTVGSSSRLCFNVVLYYLETRMSYQTQNASQSGVEFDVEIVRACHGDVYAYLCSLSPI